MNRELRGITVHEGNAAGPWSERFKDWRKEASLAPQAGTKRPGTSGTPGPSRTAASSFSLSERLAPRDASRGTEAADPHLDEMLTRFKADLDGRHDRASLTHEFVWGLEALKNKATKTYLLQRDLILTQASNRSDPSSTHASQSTTNALNELREAYRRELTEISLSSPGRSPPAPKVRIVGFNLPGSAPP